VQLKHTFITVLFVIVLSITAAGIGACSRVPQIAVEGEEARLSPVLLGVCSIYMSIRNSGNGDDNLLSAEVDIPGTITELHGVKDGKMVRKEKIPIPAKSGVELRPGSMHIMVFKLPRDVQIGNEFTLRLVFERSGEKRVTISINR